MTTEKEISIWVESLLAILKEGDKGKQVVAAERLREILKKKKKEYLLPKIIGKLERAYAKKNKVELLLARDYSSADISRFSGKIQNIFGKGKNVSVSINENLIGGFRAKTDTILVKASVKDFLEEMKKNCLSSN
jgi:F0F1-type ATP synthase delta subunit